MKKLITTVILFLIQTQILLAQPSRQLLSGNEHVQFGSAAISGTGCPIGTAFFVTDSVVHIGMLTFDQMGSALDKRSQSLVSQSACSLRVPVEVENGYSLGVRVKSLSGSIEQNDGIASKVTLDFGFVSSNFKHLEGNWKLPASDNFSLVSPMTNSDIAWTTCGQKSNMNIKVLTLAMKNANAKLGASVVAVDQVAVELMIRKCQ